MNDRSIFTLSMGNFLSRASEEYPVPKSSIDNVHAHLFDLEQRLRSALRVRHHHAFGDLQLEEFRRQFGLRKGVRDLYHEATIDELAG